LRANFPLSTYSVFAEKNVSQEFKNNWQDCRVRPRCPWCRTAIAWKRPPARSNCRVRLGLAKPVMVSPNGDILNWLIAGTDAHAKNYALLLSSAGQVRLAPLYDLASVLPYPDFDPHRIRLAMRLGGEYGLRNIGRRQWQKLAAELRLDPEPFFARAAAMADAIPDHASRVGHQLGDEGLRHPPLTRLRDRLTARALECRKLFPSVRP
jgi:hypothetical protein